MIREAGWRGVLSSFTPFSVLGTLVCCALPVLLVAAGLGSVLIALLGAFPWLIALQQHKGWLFAVAGVMLAVNYWALYRSGRACRVGGVCHSSHPLGRWMRRMYWGSVAAYAAAFVAAYLSFPLAHWFGYTTF